MEERRGLSGSISDTPGGRILQLTVIAITIFHPSPAAAEGGSSFWVRSAVGLSTMVSDDQLDTLGYDQIGFVGDALLAYSVLPWLDPYGGVTASAFVASPRETGGLLAPNAGLMASIQGDGFRPYAQTDIGIGFTGAIVRPLLRVGIGVDVPLSKELAFGPTLGYGQLFQRDIPGSSTDARFLWAGCAMQYRYQPEKKTPVRQHTAVAPREPVRVAPPSPPVEISPELLELIERTLPAPDSRVELLAPVLFSYDSDELEPIGVAMLHEVVLLLLHRVDIELLEIQGYADRRGGTSYNRELSEKRAIRVRAWLVEHGVEAGRLRIAGLGAASPIETERTEAAHQQNRRVVFRVLRLREP